MKILHVTQNYFPSKGGTQHTMKKISEYLHTHYQDEVTVFTTNSFFGPNSPMFKKIDVAEECINGVAIRRFSFLRSHKPALKIFSKTFMRMGGKILPPAFSELSAGPFSKSMKKAIGKIPVDVICASSVHYQFANYGLYRDKLAAPKPFVLYGALHLSKEQMNPIYLNRIKAADHYIANTSFEKTFLEQQGIDPQKITVAGAGIDMHEHSCLPFNVEKIKGELKIPSAHKILLCISRHEAFKGLPLMLEAYEQLKKTGKNIHLIIAGASGNYTQTLLDEEKKMTGLTVFTNISALFKNELLSIADIVVLPSKEESFGVVFLEAWRAKKPVIGAGIGAISTIIDENKNGLLFTPGNANDLSEKIKFLLQNNELANAMGISGYKKVEQFYTWENIAALFRGAYCKAIENFNHKKV